MVDRVGNKIDFWCQHGPEECYGNMIHACALDSNPPKTALEFISCCEGQENRTSDETFQKCAKEVGIKFEDLKHCSKTKGTVLQLENARKSDNVDYGWVPYITFNDKDDKYVSSDAEEHFKDVVCKLFADKPPKGCLPPMNKTNVTKA
ncbi:unnamed protein product [Callosobruchus maculatus]|uniref:Uncharacterized protein n=1 Tax=Callosobruchus maculatus TaxID=64391 RepID=A0A653BDW4_CALMS|nr:unnamed protein product [Callosobruchus maculatus]